MTMTICGGGLAVAAIACLREGGGDARRVLSNLLNSNIRLAEQTTRSSVKSGANLPLGSHWYDSRIPRTSSDLKT